MGCRQAGPGFDFRQRKEIFYLLQKHPDWLWTNPALCTVGSGCYLHGVKAVLKLATYLQFSAEFKNEWSYTSAPFMCLYSMPRNNCALL